MRRKRLSLDELELVCPNCSKIAIISVGLSLDFFAFQCPACSGDFDLLVVEVRSRTSRRRADIGGREFSVRVLDEEGNEDFIEFVNGFEDNFEFRAGDIVCFAYAPGGGDVIQVHNFTINRHMRLGSDWSELVLVFVVLAVLLFICGFLALVS